MGAVGIPIAKTVYEHLPVIDSETWEDQDLLVGSVRRPNFEEGEEGDQEVHDLRLCYFLRAQHLYAFVPTRSTTFCFGEADVCGKSRRGRRVSWPRFDDA